ncbi:MAG: tetratricopeptide repeat protein [Spirulina sp.]
MNKNRAIAFIFFVGLTGIFTLDPSNILLARAREVEEEVNPLEMVEPDPLIRPDVENTALSEAEKQELIPVLDRLALEAEAEFLAENGNTDRAFAIWYRELRLRRFLGRVAEVEALGRVGKIAWENNRNEDLFFIRERLTEIQTDAENELNLDSLLANTLAIAYDKIRFYPQALAMYEWVLAEVRETGDINALERILNTIAQLHLEWFQYFAAEAVYQELLTLARSQFDDASILRYLEQMAYLYDRAKQPEKAIETKVELWQGYLKKELWAKIPPLQISLAGDYETIGEGETASETYQDAFTLAWANQQYAYASTALRKLAELYYTYEQLDYALEIYQEQIKAAEYATDEFSIMETYERMGQIYLELENYPQALNAFQEGLKFARSLGHKEEDFLEKIDEVYEFF